MRKAVPLLLALTMILGCAACAAAGEEPAALVYGSSGYTRINPAMDEHGEINILLFNGLTAHDGENRVAPGLARDWTFDGETNTYTFYLEEDVTWHDGAPFTAEDVKFTIEAIMDPENGSENAPNYEDVAEITVLDDHTYKVFGTGKGANYSGYSNAGVDRWLTEARRSDDPQVRAEAYDRFQAALADEPAFAFLCYVDADYVADNRIRGIDPDTVMGHHGVGIFWNVTEWTMETGG